MMTTYFSTVFVAISFELFHHFPAKRIEMALWLSGCDRSGKFPNIALGRRKNGDHRIREWFELEKTLKII